MKVKEEDSHNNTILKCCMGRVLCKLRQDAGISQLEVKTLTQSTVSRSELGKTSFTMVSLFELVDEYKADLSNTMRSIEIKYNLMKFEFANHSGSLEDLRIRVNKRLNILLELIEVIKDEKD